MDISYEATSPATKKEETLLGLEKITPKDICINYSEELETLSVKWRDKHFTVSMERYIDVLNKLFNDKSGEE